ncbi:hypothetical protein WAI453_009447 [Rhynchosporium graminicola]
MLSRASKQTCKQTYQGRISTTHRVPKPSVDHAAERSTDEMIFPRDTHVGTKKDFIRVAAVPGSSKANLPSRMFCLATE